MKTGEKAELLAPCGNFDCVTAAVNAGADAVYLGGQLFNARAYASNFDTGTLEKVCDLCHSFGVKVYVTANILAHNGDLEGAAEYFAELRDMKPEQPDALIISDPGMFTIAKEVWPEAEIHISTQANNTNYQT